ncbi:MAG TPA: polyphosphate kinase 1 [Pseudomonadales bacterium]|nr:polyphosphate kinase 1 [Pseudomonadales bacterium]
MDAVNLSSPELFINRELSLLEFNRRVLEQAKDESIPLLERLKFLCIAASNLDEFFEIRVAGLKQQVAYGATQRGPDNMGSAEQLRRIAETGHALVDDQYRVLNEILIPRLDAENIRFLRRAEWTSKQAGWVKRHFTRELVPILSPIALDPAHPFPRVLNKSLNFIVTLEGKDAFGRNSGMAIVAAPRSLPRLVQLPESATSGPYDFVFLSSIIHQHVADLFPGMKATGCYQFRVTRNSDLFVDEEEIDDLKRALEGELSARRFGDEVRLELADDCPEDVEDFLVRQFELEDEDVYRCNGPVNLTRLMAIPDLIDRPDLKYPGFLPGIPTRIRRNDDIFEVIRRGDLILHHPFESFAPVVDFLRRAARDASVLAIRQTLYRTGADSAVVKALVDAARRGKEVTVVIELRARFDEEANIELANTLQEAGCHVVYGVVGHKTHAKMILVVRREGRALRRYVHLGTGNYHPRTARLYTDYGLFTCDAAIGDDIQKMFQQLTAMGRVAKLKKVIQSPFALHKGMLDLIAAEAENARAGKPARIMVKMNALVESQSIQALYAASQAGVKIDLIIRGVCALRPGVEGVSENITVRSIVGRFLEHTRVFYFENGDEDELVYLSSADWMERNFFRRVEACFPIEDRRIRQRIVQEALLGYLADNTQAWILQADGSYKRVSAAANARRRVAQDKLLGSLADG